MVASAVAVHEAGHAVTAVALHCDVAFVGLTRRGGTTCWARSDDPATCATVALSGALAEARYLGRSGAFAGAGSDLSRARAAAREEVSEDRIAEWLVERGQEAEDIRGARWPTVRVIARRLERSPMSGEAVFRFVRRPNI